MRTRSPARCSRVSRCSFEHFLVSADDRVVVDADFAELVDDHGGAFPCGSDDAIEQCGLAGAE